MKRPLKLLIGLRLQSPSVERICRSAGRILEEASSLEGEVRIPLHWNLALSPLAEDASRAVTELATEIKTRVKTRSDVLLPAGFRGAIHPLLSADELDRELAWCRRNPWSPGFKSLLGQDPQIILPFCPDPLREAAAGVYSRRGFQAIGLPLNLEQALSPYRFVLARPSQRATMFIALLMPRIGDWSKTAPLLPALGAAQPMFLLFDLIGQKEAGTGFPERALLRPLLETLGARRALEFLSLAQADLLTAGTENYAGLAHTLLALGAQSLASPLVREQAARSATLRARKRRKNDEDLRAVLEALSGQPAAEGPSSTMRSRSARPGLRAAKPHSEAEKARPGATPDNQVLIASMTGLVSLDGPAFAATFTDGRFSGLQLRGRQLLSGIPAQSYICIRGKRHFLQTESAFSFEREKESGLRSVLKARLPNVEPEARLLVDCYFRDGEEELLMDLAMFYPALPPGMKLEQAVPYELPLFTLGRQEQVLVTAEFPQQASYAETLRSQAGMIALTGMQFLLSRGREAEVPLQPRRATAAAKGENTLSIQPGPPGAEEMGFLQLRIAKARGRHLLYANPFGSYLPAPSEAFCGLTESFSLRLGVQAEKP